MSDIQEEQKRLYKRAEENDIKLLRERIDFLIDRNDEKQNIIDKAIEYINKNAFDVVNSEHKSIINVEELLNILKGDNK